MTYKPWPKVTGFHSNGKHFYFNRGETKQDKSPFLVINTQRGGDRERIILFQNQALEFMDHMNVAVREIFGFDYAAYCLARTSPAPVPDYDAPMSRLGELEITVPTEVPEPQRHPNSCRECGEPPGPDWKFGFMDGQHISQCPECGKVYHN